jgi:hypothetical protein
VSKQTPTTAARWLLGGTLCRYNRHTSAATPAAEAALGRDRLEGVIIDLLERGRVGLQRVAGLIEEPLRQLLECIVDLALERLPTPRAYAALSFSSASRLSGPGSNAVR